MWPSQLPSMTLDMAWLIHLLPLITVLHTVFSLECGEFTSPNNILQTRIVNGELAAHGEFPWQVSIQRTVRIKLQDIHKIVGKGNNSSVQLSSEELLENTLWAKPLWSKLSENGNNTSYNQIIINWPPTHPPLPTHPPDHTIPPLPTHPPDHHYPTFPPIRPLPSLPTFPPVSQNPWNPGPPKEWPPHYPPIPSYPPIVSEPTRPRPVPTLPTIPSNPTVAQTTRPPQGRPPRPPIDKSRRWQHFCGGSIIDTNWILTAAHCVESFRYSYTPGTIRIAAGSLDWRNIDEQNGQVSLVDRVIVHPGWNKEIGQNDLALLRMRNPIEYVQEDKVIVNRICLSRVINQEDSGMATSSGWGFLSKDQRVTPDLLRRVNLPVVNHEVCRNSFRQVIQISRTQVCAGQAPRGNCMGDSGSPLVLIQGNKATQIGIVSFSIPCAVPGYPDVFTRVSKFLDWIISNSGISF